MMRMILWHSKLKRRQCIPRATVKLRAMRLTFRSPPAPPSQNLAINRKKQLYHSVRHGTRNGKLTKI